MWWTLVAACLVVEPVQVDDPLEGLAPQVAADDPCHDVVEVCNDLDDNCNGVIDDGLRHGYFADADGDGFGDAFSRVEACAPPPGYVTDLTDCDDTDPARFPGAPEVCDGLDNDCNGVVDDELLFTMYYDADRDLYGDPYTSFFVCEPLPGLVWDATDCDDAEETTHPGADELCDGVDNDCDEEVDEDAIDPVPFYADSDLDGYGGPTVVGEGCDPPIGMSKTHRDCDDTDPALHPNAPDMCNGVDDDCDRDVDEDHRDGWILVAELGGVIYEVDPDTADLTVLSYLSGGDDLTSIDTIQMSDTWAFDTGAQRLGRLDVCGGVFTPVGDPGHGHTGGIVFHGTELYGTPMEWDDLVRYDLANAAPTVIGPLGINLNSTGVAYDCATDTIYGVDSHGGTLFQVDPATGLAHDFIDLGVTFEGNGLEWDHRTGRLLLSDVQALWSVDPYTGEREFIGDFGAWGFDNLAFHAPCP